MHRIALGMGVCFGVAVLFLAGNASALTIANKTEQKLSVRMLAGSSACYKTPSLKPTASVVSTEAPAKCGPGPFTLKVIGKEKKTVCTAREIMWTDNVTLTEAKGKIVCAKPKEGGGH